MGLDQKRGLLGSSSGGRMSGIGAVADSFHPASQGDAQSIRHRRPFGISNPVFKFQGILPLIE
jgi:hypothetical protein